MKYAFLTYLFFFFTIYCTFSQIVNLGEDYQKAQAKYEAGDYAGTVTDLEKLIPEVEKVYQDTSSFYEMNNMMGLSLVELKKFSQAESYLMKTINFYSKPGVNFNDGNNFIAQTTLAQVYYGLDNYSKAEQYFRNSLSIEGKLNGEKTNDYLTLLQNLANSCINQYKLKTVDSIYQKVIPIQKELHGENSLEYAAALKALADLQKGSGKQNEAETNYLAAKQIVKNLQGTKHKDYLSILNSLASMYKQRQKLADAEVYYNEMADIYRSNNGVKSQEYAACISNLAMLYKAQNKFDQAEKLLERTLKSYKSVVGEKNILYINTLSSLAGLYRSTGQYNKSEATYTDAKKLLFETAGEKNLDYADLLNNMALLFDETGRYDIAENYLKQALTITKDILSDKHPLYATTLNNLASLNKNLGHYEQAEPMYKQALAIRKEALGVNHPDYGASLNNLADFYESVNRTKEAEPLYLQALQIIKTVYGEQHHEYALCLNNLANLYEETGQYDKAEQIYKQSLSILKNVLGETHSEYASTLNNLAFLYLESRNYKEAEILFKKDLEIIKNSLGINHPNYAKALSNLADLYEHMGRYPEAEKNYLEAIRIRKEKLGEHHPDYTYSVANLARVYTATGKYAEALNYWKISIANYKEEITKYFPSMSEREKEEFYTKFRDRFEQFNSFATMRYTTDPSVLTEMYNTQLATKAILFNASNKVRQRILSSNDPVLIETFKKWQSDKEYLAQLYVLPKNEVTVNIDSLEKKTNELEKELSLKSELFKNATDIQNYTWQDIQKVLRPGEAAIEIICFRKYKADLGGTYVQYKFEGKEEKDSVYYAALIITPETKNNPQIILMKNGTDLENRFIVYYKNTIKFNVDDQFCYANYWSKIAAALTGIKKVYFSPDGIYNNINLLSVYNPATKQYILDEMEIQTVTNTKDLLTVKPISTSSKKVVLLGDPDFGGLNGTATLRSGKLNRLPGSGIEVQKIDGVLKSNNWASTLYTGSNSTEEIVKSTRDAKIIHIATHGFFEKDNEKKNDQTFEKEGENKNEPAKKNDNPLLKSGLYLSTGNKGSGEDGVLTAYEAMNLNLDNTELVVLSACETGLGESKNGEGVYGLQRAFRVAGARSIIISLWKVDDMATQKLMTMFYEEWLKSGNKRAAFTLAQNKLRKEYKDPLYWGAFIIVGE
jgi:CHAT domain-containing protein/tetratricopeptide (TPR) repeat protein